MQMPIVRMGRVPRGSLRDQGVAATRREANFLRLDGIPTTCRVIPAWTRGVVVRCRAVDASRRLENICLVEITGRYSSSPPRPALKLSGIAGPGRQTEEHVEDV